jgi:hypothetical protein
MQMVRGAFTAAAHLLHIANMTVRHVPIYQSVQGVCQ